MRVTRNARNAGRSWKMNLHGKIMNIRPEQDDIVKAAEEVSKYKIQKDCDLFGAAYILFAAMYVRGHRDARHAAAELATKVASNE